MRSPHQPWTKFFPRDHRSDAALRLCSFAARGFWVELWGIMHEEGEPYGHLTIAGVAPSAEQLARVLGGSVDEVQSLLGELEAAGVFSRTADGVVYCRRLVRDRAKAERDRANGRTGGNPSLKPQEIPASASEENPPLKGGVNPSDKRPDKAHIPESRNQIIPPSPLRSRPARKRDDGLTQQRRQELAERDALWFARCEEFGRTGRWDHRAWGAEPPRNGTISGCQVPPLTLVRWQKLPRPMAAS